MYLRPLWDSNHQVTLGLVPGHFGICVPRPLEDQRKDHQEFTRKNITPVFTDRLEFSTCFLSVEEQLERPPRHVKVIQLLKIYSELESTRSVHINILLLYNYTICKFVKTLKSAQLYHNSHEAKFNYSKQLHPTLEPRRLC